MKARKLITAFLMIMLLAFAGAGVYVGLLLQQQADISPDDTDAASQEVWDAEIPRNQEERDKFASAWATKKNASFADKKAFVLSEGARFKSFTPILTVGAETLYGRDLNYYMFLLQFDKYTSSKPLTDADVDKGLSELIYYSLILQKAQELDLVTLDSSFYNSNTKDFTKRNEIVSQMIPLVSERFVDRAEGEVIAIWFQNNFVPVSPESGREIAKRKIDELYSRLTSGELTMQDAGKLIAEDQEIIEKVDPAAVGNAYESFVTEKDGIPVFVLDYLNDAVFSLGEGQFSTVLTLTLPEDEELYGDLSGQDLAYLIIKVNKRTLGEYSSTEEYFNKLPQESKQDGDVVINIKRGK
ncbi:hypothetical protein H3C67_04900 [Candidatus Dojkabacteria bacterium]|uniref:Uncharacterized protein n=1 Tax=Candidatus Dojkabacteria bacterium TaxID=2099670 RepID=A0A952AKX2_9BACT|nr:hypothetical protein [Candidatus Dojkabacteria bacterium]